MNELKLLHLMTYESFFMVLLCVRRKHRYRANRSLNKKKQLKKNCNKAVNNTIFTVAAVAQYLKCQLPRSAIDCMFVLFLFRFSVLFKEFIRRQANDNRE